MRAVPAISTILTSLSLTATPLLAAPGGSVSVVISEFRTRGPNGANDEFIELYNRSSATIDMGGWKIMRSNASGTTSVITQIAASTTVPAGGFFLLTNVGAQGFSGTVPPNATYTKSIDDLGGVALVDDSGNVIDQTGMSAGSAYLEGTPLLPTLTNVNQSYERNFGGCFPSQDIDNNATDFRYNGSSSYPQNSLTNCAGGCTDVVCQSPLDAQCWVSPGQCTNGSCGYEQRPTNTPCSDNSVCTQNDACDVSGLCQSGTAVNCNTPPSPYCSDAQTLIAFQATGTCDDVNGCQYAQLSPQTCTWGCNGVTMACNPNPCTNVSCNSPPNDCYENAGICQAGLCNYAPKSAYTACEDGNLCTTGDTCDGGGICVTGSAVSIEDSNACTDDSCDRATGIVTHTGLGNGTSCDDGNLCNGIESCQSGTCAPGTAKTCATPPAGGCYESTGACAPSTGTCTYQPLVQGTSCIDGDLCTNSDQCDGNGTCLGSTRLCASYSTCTDTSTSRLSWSGSCDATTGNCTYSQKDTTCTVGCDSSSGLCNLDPCEGVVCTTPPSNCHDPQGTCANGTCSYSLKPVGAACNDGLACTSVDQCSAAGACQGEPIACNTPPAAATCFSSTVSRSYNVNGACLTISGLCDYSYADTTCPHGCNSSTGLCANDPCANITCDQPPTQCHKNLGTCANGACQYELKSASSTCDDANVCTENDICSSSGTCAGTPIVCNNPPNSTCSGSGTSSRVYNANGACSTLGVCAYGFVDTTCTTGCHESTGVCNEDLCAAVSCNQPPGPCSADQGTCNLGVCTYAPKPALVTCNDSDACTSNDVCDGNGRCNGTANSICGSGGSSGIGGNPGTGGLAATGGALGMGGALGTGGAIAATGGTLNTGGAVAATGGTLAATGGKLSTGGAIAATGGVTVVAASTGGLSATGGTPSAGGNSSAAGQATTAGTSTKAGSTSLGGATALGGTTALASTAGTTSTATTSVGGASATAGTANAAGNTSTAGTAGTNTSGDPADSVQEGGCNCSVPRRSNGAAWAVALLALVFWRRRRKP